MDNRKLLLQAFEATDREMKPIMEAYESWCKRNQIVVMYQNNGAVGCFSEFQKNALLYTHRESLNLIAARWIIKLK